MEPINIQLNIIQGQEQPRHAQQAKDVEVRQLIGQQMDAVRMSDEEQNQVQTTNEDQAAQLNSDGSGRGKGFLRQRKQKEEAPPEEDETRPAEPRKGTLLDVLR